jgi:hypothetical protein
LNTNDASARPRGPYFVFELLWRGVGYGLMDTLLLTIFPCFVAYRLLQGRVDGLITPDAGEQKASTRAVRLHQRRGPRSDLATI